MYGARGGSSTASVICATVPATPASTRIPCDLGGADTDEDDVVIQLASYGATPRCSSTSAAWFWVPPSRIVLPAMFPSAKSV
jgi:hypothetical protein